VVDYVLYHEMLHLKHPVELGPTQRRIHTRAFLQDERLFEGYAQAKERLKRICIAAARKR
jgi:predicted metal-dependent hydrolase